MVDFQNIGVLGCGNMGAALVRALISSGTSQAKDVFVYDTMAQAMETLKRELGVQTMVQAHDLPDRCDVLILAVKPQIFHHIAPGLQAKSGPKERVVLSVMAGVTTENIRSHFPDDYQVVRVMPNLPLSVGEGATAIETDGHSEATLLLAEHIFKAAGRTVRVTSHQMDAVTGLSGSGPAYVFEFLEGLILAGVKAGLAREVSTALVMQTARGALKLLDSGKESPSSWSAKVSSPGGTTIHGLHVLETAGFKGILMAAVEAAVARSKALSGK
ncbi:MAG: pyrroline-5-carboxylate reductase [Fibrobacteria bacterium]